VVFISTATTAYGRHDSKGQWVMRPVKSILWVR
jgi:hypothetical protein